MKSRAEIKIETEIELEQISRTVVKKYVHLMVGKPIMEQVYTNDDYYYQWIDLFNAIDIDTTIEFNNYTNKTDSLSNEQKLAFIKAHNNDLVIKYYKPSEFWIVSEWLYKNLKKRGEVVTELGIYYVWGRSESGQHISKDSVIKQIAKSFI